MSPSRPALRSSFARAVICSSAASASAGGSSQPISAALPVSWSHRSTRAFLAACSRRSFAFFGAALMTARAIAARSPAGVSRAARSSTSASAARASSSSSSTVAPAMISALYRETVPVFQPRLGAGQAGRQGLRHADQAVGPGPGLPQRVRNLVGGELLIQLPGVPPRQLGDRGELTGVRVRLHPVPPAHHPDQLSLRDPGEAVLRGGLGGDRQARAARQHIQRHPRRERGRAAARLTREDPRRAGLPRAPPPGGGGLDREQLIGGRLLDLGQLPGGEGLEGPVILVLAGGLIVLTGPGQPVLSLRVAVQPGEILVPPGVRGNRLTEA